MKAAREGIRRAVVAFALACVLLGNGCVEDGADRRDPRRPVGETGRSAETPGPAASIRRDTVTGPLADTAEPNASLSGVVRAQIDTLLVTEASDLRGSLRRHQQAVRAMLASFDADMRALHLDDHSQWSAQLEELQSDVRLMEDMSVDELHAFLPEYRAKVERLVRLRARLRRPSPND